MPYRTNSPAMSGGSLRSEDVIRRTIDLMRRSSGSKYRQTWDLWFAHHGRVEASPLDASEFIEECKKRKGLRGEPLSLNTLKLYVCILYKLYEVLVTEIELDRNPFAALWARYKHIRAEPRRPSDMIPFDRVLELVMAPDGNTRIGRRDRAMLAMLFGGALRRSEVVKLRMRDVKNYCDGLAITLRETKNGSDAIQVLPDWCAKILDEYITQRYEEGSKADSPLLTDYTKYDRPGVRHISDDLIYNRFRHWARHIGLPEECSPHWARATAITKLLTDGMPHREVQEFSRHGSIQMVERYDKRRLGGAKHPGRKLKF